MTTRAHETRARALLDLAAALVDRARTSDRETPERAAFLRLVAQVESIAWFEIFEDPDAVLDAFRRMCQDLGLQSMTDAAVEARVAVLEAEATHWLAEMEKALERMRSVTRPRVSGPASACSMGPGDASVHDRPSPERDTCRYSGAAHACRVPHLGAACSPRPAQVEGFTPHEAAEAIPIHMREESDAEPLDARERRNRGRADARQNRINDRRTESALRRQAEAAMGNAPDRLGL